MAEISRLLKIVGLFCRIYALLQGSIVEETYNVKEPTNRSHPIRFRLAEEQRGYSWCRLLMKAPPLKNPREAPGRRGSRAHETTHDARTEHSVPVR